MMSMAYLQFVVNQVLITMLILANQVAYLSVFVETGVRLISNMLEYNWSVLK